MGGQECPPHMGQRYFRKKKATAAKASRIRMMRKNLPLLSVPGVIGEELMGVPELSNVAEDRLDVIGPKVANGELASAPTTVEDVVICWLWPMLECDVVTVNPERLLIKTLMSPEAS